MRSRSRSETTRAERSAAIRTFLIADVRGYTRFTQERGDEAAARLARKFAEVASEGIEALGGDLVEVRGDEVLAVFTSARQAIRAAVELQSGFADETAEDASLPLPVGMGMDAGEAVPVGDGYRGGVLNLAARLCGQAGPGEILASEQVTHLARTVEGIRYEHVGPFELKGLDEPVQVVRIASDGPEAAQASTGAPPSTAVAPPPLPAELDPVTPLVEREQDLLCLRWAWRRTRHGHGRSLFVSGTRGIGKTRMVAELAREAHAQGSAVLYASCGSADGVRHALTRARSMNGPTLVVLDDLDQAAASEIGAVGEFVASLHESRMMVLGTYLDDVETPSLSGLIDRADSSGIGRRRLAPLAAEGAREIAALYAGRGASRFPVAAALEETGGVPSLVHLFAGRWAEEEATRRLGVSTGRAAAGRSGLRVAEAEVASNVVDLQVARERVGLYAVEPSEAAVESEERATPVICPFKGLATFSAADSEFFFGRERLVAELVARLVGSTFLGVVGPSGSGKSSAVRAGLMPALAAGVIPGSARWALAVTRPGEHPLTELGRSLSSALGAPSWRVEGDHGDVLQRAAAAIDPESRLVLLLDQFEEVFTTTRDEGERTEFLRIVTTPPGQVVVVLALRADYYGRCALYPELGRLLGTNHVLVGPMQENELRRAIELPARRVGLRVEPDLVEALVAEVEGEPGGLPLLSTTLLELWQRRDGRTLTMQSYLGTGGVQGAVARLAEDAFQRLSSEQQRLARGILLRLAGPGEGAAVVRRRVRLSEFDLAKNEDAAEVLAVLTDARLVTIGEGSVEVAHEALLREWPRFREWLEEDVQGRQLHQHLIQTAMEWDESGREPGELYRGARLASALDWTAERTLDLNELERQFLEASRAGAQREVERARRTNRRLRGLLAGVALFLTVSIVAGSLAFVLRARAQKEASNARREALVADARRLDTAAFAEGRLDRSLLLAVTALRLDDSVESRSALLTTLLRYEGAIGVLGGFPDSPTTLAIAPDGRTLAVGGFQAGQVTLLDTQTGERVGNPIGGSAGRVNGVAFSPDGNRLAFAIWTDPGGASLGIADVSTGKLTVQNDLGTDAPTGVAFSKDGKIVALGMLSESNGEASVVLWDAATGKRIGRLPLSAPPNVIPGLAFLPDGRTLVVSSSKSLTETSGAGSTVLFDLGSMKPIRTFDLGGTFSASPDGSSVAIAAIDGSIFLIDLQTGKRREMYGGHSGGAFSVGFSPDGKTLASVGDTSVILWDVVSGFPRETFTSSGNDLAFSPDGKTLYTLGQDGDVIIWDLSGNRRLVRSFPGVIGGQPPSFSVSPDGTVLAVSRDDGSVDLWNTTTLSRIGELPGSLRSPVFGAGDAFSPDGRTLAAAGQQDAVVLWDVQTMAPIGAPLSQKDARQVDFSPDGRTLATASASGEVILWDVKTGDSRARLAVSGSEEGVLSDMDFSPDGRVLATALFRGSDDKTEVVLWDIGEGKEVRSWVLGGRGVSQIDFSPDGRTLAAAGDEDAGVTFWNVDAGMQEGPPLAGQAPPGIPEVPAFTSIDFSPDGTRLVAADYSGAVSLWDAASRMLIGTTTFQAHTNLVSVQFTRGGGEALAVFTEGPAFIWDVDTESWKARACMVAGRNLTQQEWSELLPNRPYQTVCPA
jgi:WD40 repeat protein/class 3 adenylate cyclase